MDRSQASQFTTAIIVIAIGLILLSGQLNLGWGADVSRLWPLVLVALGVGRLVGPSDEGRGSAYWFLFLGGLFLMHTFRIVRLNDSWPLFIVAAGVSMMFKQRRSRS